MERAKFPKGAVSAPVSQGARPFRRQCPECGSGVVSLARPGPLEAKIARLSVLDLFRCAGCNASFRRLNMIKAAFFAVLLVSLLTALTYAGIAGLSRGQSSKREPRIKRGQIPPEVPPVLR